MATTLLEMLEAVLDRAAAEDGECFLTRMDLHAQMSKLIDTAIDVGIRSERLVARGGLVPCLADERIYLPHLDAAERRCAESVKRMLVRT